MNKHPHLDKIIADALALESPRVAVCFPCSASSIEAAVSAQNMGLIQAIMIGPRKHIEAIAEKSAIDLTGVEFVETGEDPVAAAQKSAELCRDGKANVIMKGSLHTDELLGTVVSKEGGLRTSRRMSHVFVFDLPGQPRLLLMADCVININPGLIEKRDIIQNAIDVAHALDTGRPYVAILSAVEMINPAIPGTIDAAALCKMAERGQITGAVVDGPLGYDIAISIEAARIKGINWPHAERPDILIMPNLEAGNMLYKQMVYVAKAECAGIILGTKVPIVVTSRADSPKARIASCALAIIQANAMAKSKLTV